MCVCVCGGGGGGGGGRFPSIADPPGRAMPPKHKSYMPIVSE